MASGECIGIFCSALAAACLLTVVLCRLIIPVLRAHHVGQHIFSDYVNEHKSKEGTPTMGGICFILPVLVLLIPYFIVSARRQEPSLIGLALTVCLGVANALIGFVDDYTKLSHHENQGLASWQKFLLQLGVGGLYLWAMTAFCDMSTVVHIPVLNVSYDLGIWYYFVALLVIVGVVNSTNLTDGIDGLAASVTLVVCMGLCVLAAFLSERSVFLLGALMVGGMIGFLVFNYHPAKVFMGDTGSLFIGGILVGLGFMMNEPLLLLLMCAVFVLDMLSSLIQILSIRLFHRKVFRIAPVHHQFQQMRWSEETIVYVFSGVSVLFCVLAVLLGILF